MSSMQCRGKDVISRVGSSVTVAWTAALRSWVLGALPHARGADIENRLRIDPGPIELVETLRKACRPAGHKQAAHR